MLGHAPVALSSSEPAPHVDNAWRKRKRVFGLLDEFDRRLAAATSHADVSTLARQAFDRLSREQAGPDDRMYLQRSITRLATAVRRAGWPSIAADTLEGAITRGLGDEYIFAEAVLNRLTLSQWATAERLMADARSAGLSSPTAYSSVLSAYARHGWVDKCREFFAHADSERMVTDECCAALIKAYGKGGFVDLAESIFEYARHLGVDDAECYIALVNTYAHASRSADARIAFDAATARGIADQRLFAGMILAYCKCGFSGEAERVWHSALEQGQVSDIAVAVLVDWYAQRGHFRRAEKLLARAEAASVPGDAAYLALAAAYQRRGHFSAARRMRGRARKRVPAASLPRLDTRAS